VNLDNGSIFASVRESWKEYKVCCHLAIGERTPAPAKKPEGVSAPPSEPSPEMLEVVGQFKERHYASWLNESIPALDGLSPREAAKRAASRKKLLVLLNEIEYRESRLPEAGRYDVAKLRTALGPD